MIEIKFDPFLLLGYFDDKVREQCRSCKRYGISAQCPPYLPSLEYFQKVLSLYKNGIIVYEQFKNDKNLAWQDLGKQSSLKIHNYLLNKRQELFNQGHVFALIFGSGSCKWCPNCINPCRNPDKSIIPIEGCGFNVIELMKEFNIEIQFPIENKDSFYRIGMILYD